MVNSGFLSWLVMLMVLAMCTVARAAVPRAHSNALGFDQIRYIRGGGIAGKFEQIIITPDGKFWTSHGLAMQLTPRITNAAGIGDGEGLYLIVQLETRNEE